MAIFQPIIPEADSWEKDIDNFCSKLSITRITAKLLLNRGITDPDQANLFLNPSIKHLNDPFKLADMNNAVDRIKQALLYNERITIYGDYDVDGVTSSSALFLFLKDLGANVDIYIPNRYNEGYGLNADAIGTIASSKTSLIITVDCGINAFNEVRKANELGMDIIITDHHNVEDNIPDALAVINPKRIDSEYSFRDLAGVGVASKLIQAMGGISAVEKYIDLIALGTIADIVPLIGENRILVSKGLEKINNNPRIGIEALIQVCGFKDKRIGEGQVAFGLAPRLNAAGRMSTAKNGFKLLVSDNMDSALTIAQLLNKENIDRQEIESQLVQAAQSKIYEQDKKGIDRIIILDGYDWHPGVIGIAASKITELFNRPAILISVKDGLGVASARSIKGFNIYDALKQFSNLLVRFGGHQYAAGFTIEEEKIPILKKELVNYANNEIDDNMLIPSYSYDTCISNEDINMNLADEIEKMSPFGIGNPCPAFLLKDVSICDCWTVGRDSKHLKMTIGINNRSWDGIGFGFGCVKDELNSSSKNDIIASLQKNEWEGLCKLQFQIKSIKPRFKDKDDVLGFSDLFYFKYYDAFLSEFMYNECKIPYRYIPKIKNEKYITMGQLVDIFSNYLVEHVILINSFELGQKFLDLLLCKNIIDRVIIGYGCIPKIEGRGVNAVVLAPDISNISLDDYTKVFLFEDEINSLMYPTHLLDSIKNRLFIIKSNTDNRINISNSFGVQRDDFVYIYKWFRSRLPGRNIWSDFYTLLSEVNVNPKYSFNGFKLMLILDIFKELSFISIEKDRRYLRIACNPNPSSRSLKTSTLYMYYKNWFSMLVENG